jgi:hypothetical protein
MVASLVGETARTKVALLVLLMVASRVDVKAVWRAAVKDFERAASTVAQMGSLLAALMVAMLEYKSAASSAVTMVDAMVDAKEELRVVHSAVSLAEYWADNWGEWMAAM